MKRIVLLNLIGFFVFGFSSGQEINQLDTLGQRTGIWKKYYPNNRIRYEGEFKNGKEVGVFKFYSMNSSIHPMVIKTFSSNSNEATVQFFNNKGILESEGEMISKNRIGQWVYYHKDGKTVMIEEHYENGKLSGEYKLYYKNKRLTKFAYYKDGELHGNCKQYTDAGILTEDINYVNGELDGDAVYYETNGNVKQIGQYTADLRVGVWEFYKDGILATTKKIDPIEEKKD